MSIKQFIAGFALEKASQIKEAKKDILETIQNNLTVQLADSKDRYEKFLETKSDAQARMTELLEYQDKLNLNNLEIAAVSMKPEMHKQVMENVRSGNIDNIKQFGIYTTSPGLNPNLKTPQQYVDIFAKEKISEIYPTRNVALSNISKLYGEGLVGFATKGFAERKGALAESKAEVYRSMYALPEDYEGVKLASLRVPKGLDLRSPKERIEFRKNEINLKLSKLRDISNKDDLFQQYKQDIINNNPNIDFGKDETEIEDKIYSAITNQIEDLQTELRGLTTPIVERTQANLNTLFVRLKKEFTSKAFTKLGSSEFFRDTLTNNLIPKNAEVVKDIENSATNELLKRLFRTIGNETIPRGTIENLTLVTGLSDLEIRKRFKDYLEGKVEIVNVVETVRVNQPNVNETKIKSQDESIAQGTSAEDFEVDLQGVSNQAKEIMKDPFAHYGLNKSQVDELFEKIAEDPIFQTNPANLNAFQTKYKSLFK